MVAVAFLFHFILSKTRAGRYTYAVGSNEEAARLSGIKISQVQKLLPTSSPVCSRVWSGIILSSRMVTSQPNSASGYELNAIAAASLAARA